jgi:hypothetical protein
MLPSGCKMTKKTELSFFLQCFVGNPVAAFRHLQAATHYFATSQSDLHQRYSTSVEPLRSCIAQLELVMQAVLPLPSNPFFRENAMDIFRAPTPSDRDEGLDLHSIIATHPAVNKSIIAPLSGTLSGLGSLQIKAFQAELLRWRDASNSLFHASDDESAESDDPSSCWAHLEELPIPPRPRYFPSASAATTAALYYCYMARTMWLLSITTNTTHPYEISAYLYSYQILRIAEGLLSNKTSRSGDEIGYFPCEALNIGLALILYLSAQCCYSSVWQQWIVDKLHHIGQEGLFNSKTLATCLDMLKTYQHSAQKCNLPHCRDNTGSSRSPLGPPVSRIIPTLVPDLDSREFVGYYMQVSPGCHDTSGVSRLVLKIVGRTSWRAEDQDNLRKKCSVELQTGRLALKNTSDLDAVIGIQSISGESFIRGWDSLFQSQASQMDRGVEEYIHDCSFPNKAESSTEACASSFVNTGT